MLATHGLRHAAAAEHSHLDELFESFQDWKPAHPAKAAAFFRDFAAALGRHLAFEEATAFPLYERKTGGTALTAALRDDHERIWALARALAFRLGRGDAATEPAEERLLDQLLAHGGREEDLLYRPLDELLGEEEKEALVRSLPPAE
jgi:hemerythrin superfamily protein